MTKRLVLLAVAALATVSIASAQSVAETAQHSNQQHASTPKPSDKALLMLSLDELHWVVVPENKDMQFAPITGDHTKGGPYTQMRRVKGGTDHGSHTHSVEITDVVISGLWYAGPDMASARNFGPGSVIVVPANVVHVSGCRHGSDCVFYHTGRGKFDFKPVRHPLLDKKSGD